LHQHQYCGEHRSAERHGEREALAEVGEEQRGRGAVEAKARLEPEGPPDRERQVDELDEERHAGDDGQPEPGLGEAAVAPGGIHPEPSRVSLNSRATRGSGRASLRLARANGMRARMSRMTFSRAWCLSSARTSIHGACC